LVDNDRVGICVPASLSVSHRLRNVELLDVIWSLENIDIQASADVPRNVAM